MCTEKAITTAIIRKQTLLAENTYLLEVDCASIATKIKPGNFVNISLTNDTQGCLLKRPLSVHYVIGNRISFLYKVKGAVTKIMSSLKDKAELQIIGPLGNSFSEIKNKKVLLIGGGMGIAPLIYYAQSLKQNNSLVVVHGVKNKKEIIKWDNLEVAYHVDEVEGCFVCDKAEDLIRLHSIDHVVSCGPLPMMQKVVESANKMKVRVEVSLEARMACGFGACLGCVLDTKTGYKRVCVDGPVFEGSEIW